MTEVQSHTVVFATFQIYTNLSGVDHMTVYKKEDIPDRYHLKEHYRVPPLLLVADEGYAILRVTNTVKI